MAKIRAYKLAEELGIEKQDFVEKAKALGVELKSAMSALTEEQAEDIRSKLGTTPKPKKAMDERRLERSGGSTIIRRRKRVEPDPVPEPVAEVAPEGDAAASDDGTEATPEPIAAVEGQEEIAATETDAAVAPEPVGEGQAPSPVAPAPGPASDAATPARKDAGRGSAAPSGAAAEDRKGKQRKRMREVVNLQEREQFGRQVTSRGGASRRAPAPPSRAVTNPRRKRRDAPAPLQPVRPVADQKRIARIDGEISVGELAKLVGIKVPIVQGKLMAMGIMVTVNQVIDVPTCEKIATELGFEILDTGFKETEFIADREADVEADDDNRKPRPPIVTVMGHVDHGKTSILDAIRKANVVDTEAGGITQHIGAYQVGTGSGTMTFIDTPGHAAFTQMRARGANATDLTVLVVAVNDGVMPQTIEAIEHCKAAGCPIVVAINKCDLPDADSSKARQRLMEHGIVSEEFGGDTICVDVSAKTGDGLDQLLEMLTLQAEVLELKADPDMPAHGVVLEAHLDKGRGPAATVLIQDGTLHPGDVVVIGNEWGRVRLMEDSDGNKLSEAPPSFPVRLNGLSGVPAVGSTLDVVKNERSAKSIVSHRESKDRSKQVRVSPKLSLEQFLAQAGADTIPELRLVVKSDVAGTREAVVDALEKLSAETVTLKVLSAGVGGITENDVALAAASDAIVIGFNVRPDGAARRAADNQGVEIRGYTIIMKLLDEVRSAMAGLLPPTVREVSLGRAEVRDTFVIPKLGTIAGSLVTEGRIKRNSSCRLVRDGVQLYEGKITSLRRFKDDTAEVGNGLECGIGVGSYNDIKIGDVIEAFDLEEEPATL